MTDYRRSFIELIAPVENVPEPLALGQFLNGLKKEIRAEVRLLGPKSLEQAMELAIKVEDKTKTTQPKRLGLRSPNQNSSFGLGRPNSTPSHLQPLQTKTNPNPLNTTLTRTSSNTVTQPLPSKHNPTNQNLRVGGGVRRLSDQELQYRRENGLCFRCDGKWEANHKCQNRELSVMISGEDTEDINEKEENEEEEGGGPQFNTVEVSICSVVGLTSPKKMKMEGVIASSSVVVMIDPGATHNFISTSTMQRLGLTVTGNRAFGVSLGNGATVQGEGQCEGVELEIQGVPVKENFLPLELRNSDVILGIQWLEKLGDVTTNWKAQRMSFEWQGN